jgi:arylsulfatase A-like enzyme
MRQETYRNLRAALVTCFLACVILMSCGGDGVDEGAIATGAQPIIVIALDGLRADALGSYGALAATPALDALATESVRFEWAFAQAPQALPSLATLFSGLYPTSNGLRAPGDSMADETETLAEVLGAAGYATAAFVEGRAGDNDYGLAQGFDSYQTVAQPGQAGAEWMRAHADENFLLVIAGWSHVALEQVRELLDAAGHQAGIDQRVEHVLASRATDEPLEFDDADLAWARAWYAARVQVIDSQLEGFLKEVQAVGLDRRATLIVLGSNGFALQEHGDLFGESLHAPVTHVPVLLRFPGGRNAHAVPKIVEIVDLMPTLVEVAGQTVPHGVQGTSLLPMIDGGGQPPYVAFGESPQLGGQRFVALGGMNMVSGIGGENGELYDLAADPAESVNLAEAEGKRLEVMTRHLEAWEKMVAAASLDPDLRTVEELDEDTLKQLKSLGYIQ